jgi:branched-chain amino acid transport system ATP-binding protein
VTILKAAGIGISFEGANALDGVSFCVSQGEIVSVIGPNGAGKTTLINVISGIYKAQRGHVELAGVDVTRYSPDRLAALGLSRTFQNLKIFQRMTTLENVMVGRHLREDRSLFADLVRCPSVTRQNRVTRQAALGFLDIVGLRDSADVTAGSLSYGACKRLEIARALAAEPGVLLLDEPAAGCNAVETEEIESLIRMLVRKGIAVVLVEHDMRLVMKVSDRILVLHHGETLAEGTPGEVRDNPAVIDAYLGKRRAREVTSA